MRTETRMYDGTQHTATIYGDGRVSLPSWAVHRLVTRALPWRPDSDQITKEMRPCEYSCAVTLRKPLPR